MEDPPPLRDEAESDEDRRRRRQQQQQQQQKNEEEAMERLLLQQEQEQQEQQQVNDQLQQFMEQQEQQQLQQQLQQQEEEEEQQLLEQDLLMQDPNQQAPLPPTTSTSYFGSIYRWSYTQASLCAAVALLLYALRTRQQWYLALVFIRSSKIAYIILGNALVALCVGIFKAITKIFLNGLRLHEAEGLGDFFRWHVTETCLALTMFRNELTVSNGILFLVLVLAKCLHWVANLRESHLRVTEESIVLQQDETSWWKGWPVLRWQHAKLWLLLVLLQVLDIFAVQWCGQDILANGPSVSILFGFEAAILLVSAWNNLVLWHLHALDGWMHYLHEQTTPNQRMHRWIHPWKEHKATFTFAVEVQAQAAKFLFYITFFAIVLTYYGMPINLFREVYVSFQALKQRLIAFAKYRRLMANMNRFQDVNEEELEEAGRDCIICRDEMTINDCKKLPGCGHVFHKSCLREWLVQQQSCPTCRGDITAMEQQAEVDRARREAAEARALQEQEVAAVPEPEAEDIAPAPAPAPTPMSLDNMPRRRATNRTRLQQQMLPTSSSIPSRKLGTKPKTTKKVRISPAVKEQSPFPALYRVIKEEGAPVWNDARDTVTRTIPNGFMVLATKLEWKQDVGFMMQLPDGWVHEETVMRVRTLASLKQMGAASRQQRKEE